MRRRTDGGGGGNEATPPSLSLRHQLLAGIVSIQRIILASREDRGRWIHDDGGDGDDDDDDDVAIA